MENIPVLSNRLDESNGIVENVLEVKTTTKKAPWFLRFAPKAKGLVSFVQNLLSPLTRKEGVRGGQFSAFFQSAAAVASAVVGIGLLASPFLVQADDEDDEIPKIKSIYVTNHGSTGFEIEFRVSSSFPYFIAEGYRSSLYERYWTTTWRPRLEWRRVELSPSWDCGLCSDPVDWYEIPNYAFLPAQNPLIFLLL